MAHATKIAVVLNLGVGFISLNLLFKVEEISKKVSFVLQKYEAKFAEKALETPLVVQESMTTFNPYIVKPICLAFVFVLFYLLFVVNQDGAPVHAKYWSSRLVKSKNPPSVPEVKTDNILVESANTLSHEPGLVESTSTNSLTSISETLPSLMTPELVASVIENLPV